MLQPESHPNFLQHSTRISPVSSYVQRRSDLLWLVVNQVDQDATDGLTSKGRSLDCEYFRGVSDTPLQSWRAVHSMSRMQPLSECRGQVCF